MRWSLRLGSVAGIGIFIHWTFFLLLGWILLFEGVELGIPAAVSRIALVLTIFACVVLHELGHALAARRFGIRTRDITLLPIGGVARLERMPDDPVQELAVAAAGPAVNVVIAAGLFLVLWGTGGLAGIAQVADPRAWVERTAFVQQVMLVNIALVVFNLLPAFPMDGGRILRALLALAMDFGRATRIAAGVGQALAVGLAILGLFTEHYMLVLIGVFVFLGAGAEAQAAQMRGVFAGVPVRDAMVTRFRVLTEDSTLAEAEAELLAGSQPDFPVLDRTRSRIVGILPRQELLRAMASHSLEAPVSSVMRSVCDAVGPNDPLDRVFERMQTSGCPLAPVVVDGRLVGIVTPENVGEFVMVRSVLRRPRRAADLDP